MRLDQSGSTAGKNAAIAVDPNRYLYIAYRWREEPYGSELRYATIAPEHQFLSLVDDKEYVGKHSSVAIDNEGKPHISYFDETSGNLKYARYTGEYDPWTIEVVDRLGIAGQYTSLAITESGQPCISYIDMSGSDLKFASRDRDQPWEVQTIDSGPVAGSNTSLAIDHAGRFHISYTGLQANNYASLRYATRAAGALDWEVHTVDSEGFVGQRSAICVDPSGRLHVSYRVAAGGALKYATRASDSEQWNIETVYQGASGRSTGICAEGNGRVHISFYRFDDGVGSLMYATRDANESEWRTTFADYGGIVGEYNAIAVDKHGRIHISYSDHQHGDLKYITYQSGLRSGIQTLDSSGRVGTYNSIAVDASGQVAISYYDTTNRDLRCVRPLLSGLHSFAAHGDPERFIRHRYNLCELTTIESDLDRADATFRLVPGLAEAAHGHVSFEASNYPAHFLRHQYFRLKIHEYETEDLYRRDATFRVVRGLADSQAVSFESHNYPGHYISHNARDGSFELKIEKRDVLVKDNRTQEATFTITPALSAP